MTSSLLIAAEGTATGTGVVLATRGPEVAIPAGARYRVRLADSLIVKL